MLKPLSALLILLALSWPTPAAVKRPPTTDELVGVKRPAAPTISPDGRFVAYTTRETNWTDDRFERQIWLANTQTGELLPLTNSKGTNSDPLWSPDGRWLAFTSDRDATPQIYVISPFGGEARKVTNIENGVGAFAWSPDGTRFAFTTLDPDTKEIKERRERYSDFEIVRHEYRMSHLWAINVSGDGLRRLTQGKYTVGSFSWSPNGRKLAFDAETAPTLTAEVTANLYVYSFDDDTAKKIIDEQGPDRNPHWSPDGKQIVFETVLGRPHYFTQNLFLGIISAEGGQVSNITAKFDERVSLVDWAPQGIYFTADQGAASHLFRVDTNGASIERITPQESAVYSSFTFSKDFRKVAFTEADATHFLEVYVSSIDAFHPKKLSDFAAQWKSVTLASREMISWKNSEGAAIEGVLIKPADFDPNKRYPLLVVIHGGPGDTASQPIAGFDYYYPVEIWAAKGALILEPNYRGSSGYGMAFHRLTVRTLGFGDYDDIISGVNYLVERGWVDKDRTGAMGWSFGGFISAWITTNSDRFKAVSVGAGTTDWVVFDTWTDIQEISRDFLGASPWADPEIYRKTSPITNIKNAKTPTMIQHGEFDPLVPIAGAYELYQGLVDHGVPVRFYLYKGFGHNMSKPKAYRAVMEQNLNWFNHYIWNEPDQESVE